nr:xylulose kinase-1 [Tanacetum cinerariifolium]
MAGDDNNGEHPETFKTSPPNGNGLGFVTTYTIGIIKVLPPKTAEEVVARERKKKARTTLLMALPEDHLAKFHKMADAKEMWEAIKSRFSGNDESKKIHKYLLKQQFEGFSVSTLEGLYKRNQDNRRRDDGYNRNKTRDNARRLAYQDDSKALVQLMEMILTGLDMLRKMLRTML